MKWFGVLNCRLEQLLRLFRALTRKKEEKEEKEEEEEEEEEEGIGIERKERK